MSKNKLKNTVVVITTGLLATSLSGCSLVNKIAFTAFPEVSTFLGIANTPSALPTTSAPVPAPAAPETGAAGTKANASSTPKSSKAVGPFDKEKNARSATWGWRNRMHRTF